MVKEWHITFLLPHCGNLTLKYLINETKSKKKKKKKKELSFAEQLKQHKTTEMKTKEEILYEVIKREQPDRELLKEEIEAGVYVTALTAMEEYAAENAVINIHQISVNVAMGFLEWKIKLRVRSSDAKGHLEHWFPNALTRIYSTQELFDFYFELTKIAGTCFIPLPQPYNPTKS